MENTPLQTLLDERDAEWDKKFRKPRAYLKALLTDSSSQAGVAVDEEEKLLKAFLKESILQGVRLGLAMGRECVEDEFAKFGSKPETKTAILAALEAKEKELCNE